MIVTGKSLFGFSHSNQLVAYQKLIPDEIDIAMIPNQEGGKPGQYLKPSMLISMAETSGAKDGGGRAHRLLHHRQGRQRHPADRARRLGRPGDPREHHARSLGPTEKKIIDYLDVVATSSARCRRRRRRTPASSTARCAPPGTRSPSASSPSPTARKKYYDNAVAILGRA